MIDYLRRIATSSKLRALLPNAIPFALREDGDVICYKDKDGNVHDVVSADDTQTLTNKTFTSPVLTGATFDAIAGSDSSLGITGLAAAQGGDVVVTGGTSSTAGNVGGAGKVVGGTPGATSAGGAAELTGGAGGATSGVGGAATVTAGAGTAGNSAGGVGSVTGGAGQGSAAGGIGKVVGGQGGATGAGGKAQVIGGAGGATSGAGAAAEVTGGAGTAGNGNGGSVVLAGGAAHGSGIGGVIIERSVKLVKQGAPTAKTVSATLTAAEVLAGIITVNQAAGATSAQQLPLAADLDTALPDSAAGDAFDFSVINTSTVDAEDASVTTNTGWTLVGSMDIHAYSAAGSLDSSARFRARKTGAGAWTLYRIA